MRNKILIDTINQRNFYYFEGNVILDASSKMTDDIIQYNERYTHILDKLTILLLNI